MAVVKRLEPSVNHAVAISHTHGIAGFTDCSQPNSEIDYGYLTTTGAGRSGVWAYVSDCCTSAGGTARGGVGISGDEGVVAVVTGRVVLFNSNTSRPAASWATTLSATSVGNRVERNWGNFPSSSEGRR